MKRSETMAHCEGRARVWRCVSLEGLFRLAYAEALVASIAGVLRLTG